MTSSKILLINLFLVVSAFITKAQTTTIDFTTTPYINAGNETWDPNYWDNGGCGFRQKFGPNPLPLNGHNIRAVGGTYMRNVLQRSFVLSAARNGVKENVEVHNDWNAILSIEYSFAANKSYIIEFKGLRSEGAWDSNYNQPARYKKCVFWIKLDDSPVISTPSQNPCGYDLHPVEKSVGRYSKLIADPSMAFADKTYSVKFSPLENKSALKIILDPSPADPNLSFNSDFALYYVKITEIPYEEDSRYTAVYENVPREQRIGEVYNISVEQPPAEGGGTIVRPTLSPNQWIPNSNGIGYHVNLSSVISNFNVSNVVQFSIYQPWNGVGRPTRGEYFPIPKNYKNTYYTFVLENHDIIINTDNLPTSSVEFYLNYNP